MRLLDCFSCAFFVGSKRTSAQLNCDTVQDVTQLREAMGKPGLHLVIGGKSLGKTKIVKTIVDNGGDEAPLLYVNMRLPPVPSSLDVMQCVQAEGKQRWNEKNVPPWLTATSRAAARAVLATVAQADSKNGKLVEATVAEVWSFLFNITSPEDYVKAFVAAAVAGGQVPVIMIDEANLAFPTNGENGSENAAKREAASKALATFVALTKEERKVSVILIASDYAFPLGLERLGFNKYDALKTIVAPEVEEEPMLEVLKEWGLSQDLAQELWEALRTAFLKLAFVSSCSCKTGSNFVVLRLVEFLINHGMHGSEQWIMPMSNRHIANDFVLWAGRSSMRPSVETFFCATRQSTSSLSNSSWVSKGSSTPSTSEAMPA